MLALSRILLTMVLLAFCYISIKVIWTKNVDIYTLFRKKIERSIVSEEEKKPLIRISYQETGNLIIIAFENIGDAPANYFTADIRASEGVFSVGDATSDFELSTSGEGGNWTVITGRNVLPQHKGAIKLISRAPRLKLEDPKVKSDSRYVFVGLVHISIGPEETVPK